MEDLQILRHSVSHVMAMAVKKLYPEVKLAIGPATDDGFYYDFDVPQSISDADLKQIETEMKSIIKKKVKFIREEVSKSDALKIMNDLGENYKSELISDLEDGTISLYRNDNFVDLCKGPHIEHTGRIKAFKLLKVAGAYWRGDEKNKMLQRIYGTAFFTKEELVEYLNMVEEAKKRDHRKLGKELDLFSFQEEGPGFVFWHPNGMKLYDRLIDFWKKLHEKYGYEQIKTPIILNEDLWHRSGHWDNYRENMYFVSIDENPYAIKPMNCPGGLLVYKNNQHSYRDFPLRMAELGMVHRHEKSGVLHGLMRVRQFTQDDAHIYCTEEQIEQEVIAIIDLVSEIYSTFGFNYDVELSTRPDKSIGSDEVWQKAESSLETALEHKGIDYVLNPGDGAFYGPKIDFHIKDCIGRSWQCGTIQLDFSMPERFDLHYIGDDGEKHRPVMLHRAILGSIERFIGILIEHFAGVFPVWLAPEAVRIIPVNEVHGEYAELVKGKIKEIGIECSVDLRNEKLGYRIREAEMKKIPYVIIVGDKEVENKTVSVRSKNNGELGSLTIDNFVGIIGKEIV